MDKGDFLMNEKDIRKDERRKVEVASEEKICETIDKISWAYWDFPEGVPLLPGEVAKHIVRKMLRIHKPLKSLAEIRKETEERYAKLEREELEAKKRAKLRKLKLTRSKRKSKK